MEAAFSGPLSTSEQDRLLALTLQRERGRLLAYIRRRIADAAEAEDVLQESFYELLLAYRMLRPVEQVGAWLARVARNRIIDRFRRKGTWAAPVGGEMDAGSEAFAGLLPAGDDDAESGAIRELLLEEIECALGELPPEQREVFMAHELEGVSFRELAARTGESINTLLSRKHYALRFLRARLQGVWDDWLMA